MVEPLHASTESADDTRRLAGLLAPLLRSGDVISLTGDLGAGKTVWTQGLAAALEVAEHVTSPTFTLVKQYAGRIPLYHVDAYRLSGAADLVDLGYEEWLYGDGVTVIEWGSRVEELLPDERLDIEFRRGGARDHRELTVRACGGDWPARAASWMEER